MPVPWGALRTQGSGGNPGATLIWFQLRPFLNAGNPRCTGAFEGLCADIIGADVLNEELLFCGGRGANGTIQLLRHGQPGFQRELTMVYNYSDDNFFPGPRMYATGHATKKPHARWRHLLELWAKLFINSWICLAAIAGATNRTSPDLKDPRQVFMWFSGMFSATNGTWFTAIGRNGYTAPNRRGVRQAAAASVQETIRKRLAAKLSGAAGKGIASAEVNSCPCR